MPAATEDSRTGAAPLLQRAAGRSTEARFQAATDDVARIVEATYRVIQRTGTIDPRMRLILDEAKCSSSTFYRHFASKDELLLAIIDDGRRQMAEYLAHRMAKAAPGLDQISAWIEGVIAQAVDPEAAARTRPFVANSARLDDMFPEEQVASKQVLLRLLTDAIATGVAEGRLRSTDIERDALVTFDLAFAFVQRYVLAGVQPSDDDIQALVSYCLRALGAS